MTTDILTQAPVCVPRYTTAHTPQTLTASFSESKSVDVERNRERSYPELGCSAPKTRSVYVAFSELLPKGTKVWDFGCGSGLGTAVLHQAGHRAVGIDDSPIALDFARLLAPELQFISPGQLEALEDAPEVILIVDVLGLGESPRQLLFDLHKLAPKAKLLLAEPRASVAQHLDAPQRGAFSERSLEELIARAGYSKTDSMSCSTFTILAAEPSSVGVGNSFDLAEKLTSQGLLEEALATLSELTTHSDTEISRAALLDSAELNANAGRGDAASSLYLQVLGQSARDPSALAALSQLTLASGNLEDSVTLAVQAMDADSTHAGAACSLGLAAERISPAEGLKAWQLAAALAPAEPIAQSRLSEHAAHAGHHVLAIAALEQLRAHNPNQGSDYHVTLSWLLLGAGRPQDARLEARIASTIAPEDENVRELWEALSQT